MVKYSINKTLMRVESEHALHCIHDALKEDLIRRSRKTGVIFLHFRSLMLFNFVLVWLYNYFNKSVTD